MTPLAFLFGLLIGALLGVLIMALMFMARDGQEGMDE